MFLEQQLEQVNNKLDNLMLYVQLMTPDLTSQKEVMHYLQVSRQTFSKYLENGTIKENLHYVKEGDKNIFIPQEVIKLKAIGLSKKTSKSKMEKVDGVLNGMGINI